MSPKFPFMAALVGLLASHIFPCGMLGCREPAPIMEKDLIKALRQRLSRTPSYSIVNAPRLDTARQEHPSTIDSVCSKTYRIVTRKVEGTISNRGIEKPLQLVEMDTIDRSYSCPNLNCSRDYSCAMETVGSNHPGQGNLDCKCNGSLSGAHSGMGFSSCEGSLYVLGRNVGGIIFKTMEAISQERLSKACPTDVIGDPWIPIVGGNLEIRSKIDIGITIKHIPLELLLN